MLRRIQGQPAQGFRNHVLKTGSTLGSLGDDGSTDDESDGDQTSYTAPSQSTNSYDTYNANVNAILNSPTGSTSTAGSGANAYSLAAAIAGAAATVAAPIVKAANQQAPYYITNPLTGASVLYNPNTGTTSGTSAALASLASINPTYLLLAAAAVAALMMTGGRH
jgi:hypothetical protein